MARAYALPSLAPRGAFDIPTSSRFMNMAIGTPVEELPDLDAVVAGFITLGRAPTQEEWGLIEAGTIPPAIVPAAVEGEEGEEEGEDAPAARSHHRKAPAGRSRS